jgi:hypothetical protein
MTDSPSRPANLCRQSDTDIRAQATNHGPIAGKPVLCPDEQVPGLDHNDLGSNRSKVIKPDRFQKLSAGCGRKTGFHFSSSRSRASSFISNHLEADTMLEIRECSALLSRKTAHTFAQDALDHDDLEISSIHSISSLAIYRNSEIAAGDLSQQRDCSWRSIATARSQLAIYRNSEIACFERSPFIKRDRFHECRAGSADQLVAAENRWPLFLVPLYETKQTLDHDDLGSKTGVHFSSSRSRPEHADTDDLGHGETTSNPGEAYVEPPVASLARAQPLA